MVQKLRIIDFARKQRTLSCCFREYRGREQRKRIVVGVTETEGDCESASNVEKGATSCKERVIKSLRALKLR